MSEYFYPDHDSEAFMEEINERLALVAKVVEVEGMLSDKFKVEGVTELTDGIQSAIREVAEKHYRAPATFDGKEFWFFALP